MYAFDGALLGGALKQVTTDNAKGEEYLTDVVTILRDAGHRVGGALDRGWNGPLGVNDRVQLAEARRLLNDRAPGGAHARRRHDRRPAVDLDRRAGRRIEPDAVIKPDTQLHGATHIAAGAEVGPNCTLTDTSVGEDAVVVNAVCDSAEIGPRGERRPLRLPAAGHETGPQGQGRHVRRDEEGRRRRGRQGART